MRGIILFDATNSGKIEIILGLIVAKCNEWNEKVLNYLFFSIIIRIFAQSLQITKTISKTTSL